MDRGFESPLFKLAVARFRKLLADMEAALSRSHWLVRDSYTLADVELTPYLHRLDDLGLWPLLRGAHPNVSRWLAAVQARPSHEAAMAVWRTDEEDERYCLAASSATPHLAAAIKVI
jgi:glutathione S-transferase